MKLFLLSLVCLTAAACSATSITEASSELSEATESSSDALRGTRCGPRLVCHTDESCIATRSIPAQYSCVRNEGTPCGDLTCAVGQSCVSDRMNPPNYYCM